MNAREREEYLREYSILKGQGKPFFPYAVAKDSLMACVTLAVIILMSILLGAELGPKADPTTTTYTPRPEWYFFFLFELLRVVKPPELVFLATIGIPTICLVLLLLLPLLLAAASADVTYDRLLHADREPQNWLHYSGNYSGNRYSPLTQINRNNVRNLQLKWSYHPLYAKNTNSQNKMENTPLVVDGVMYTGTALEIVALDAVTGRE